MIVVFQNENAGFFVNKPPNGAIAVFSRIIGTGLVYTITGEVIIHSPNRFVTDLYARFRRSDVIKTPGNYIILFSAVGGSGVFAYSGAPVYDQSYIYAVEDLLVLSDGGS